MNDVYTLRTFDLPQPHGAIVTATEQTAAVGGKGQAVHHSAMALQRDLQERNQKWEVMGSDMPTDGRCLPHALSVYL